MKRSALGICVCSTDLNQQSSKDAKNLNRRTCRCGYTQSMPKKLVLTVI